MEDELTAIGDGIGAIETCHTCDVSQVQESALYMLAFCTGAVSLSVLCGGRVETAVCRRMHCTILLDVRR
jgi:hypothetical protein